MSWSKEIKKENKELSRTGFWQFHFKIKISWLVLLTHQILVKLLEFGKTWLFIGYSKCRRDLISSNCWNFSINLDVNEKSSNLLQRFYIFNLTISTYSFARQAIFNFLIVQTSCEDDIGLAEAMCASYLLSFALFITSMREE